MSKTSLRTITFRLCWYQTFLTGKTSCLYGMEKSFLFTLSLREKCRQTCRSGFRILQAEVYLVYPGISHVYPFHFSIDS